MSSCVTSRHLSLSIVRWVPVLPMDPIRDADLCPITDKVGSGALTALTHLAPCWPR